jgi:glycoside/pentoside/hexuronide:cation symporter, GPH family
MMGYGVLATLLLWTTFATTRERAAPGDAHAPRLRELVRVVRGNGPFWIVLAIFVLSMLAFTLRQSAVVYFLKYNLGREDLVPLFFGGAAPAALIGIACTPWLARRLGKAQGLVAGGLVAIAGGLGVVLTPYDRVGWIFLFYVISTVGAMPVSVMGWAMIPDTVRAPGARDSTS